MVLCANIKEEEIKSLTEISIQMIVDLQTLLDQVLLEQTTNQPKKVIEGHRIEEQQRKQKPEQESRKQKSIRSINRKSWKRMSTSEKQLEEARKREDENQLNLEQEALEAQRIKNCQEEEQRKKQENATVWNTIIDEVVTHYKK